MKKLFFIASLTIFIVSCTESISKNAAPKTAEVDVSLSSSCEQVDFSTIAASNLNLFTTSDTVFHDYEQESILIHIPDGSSISAGDNKMKILLQSSNYNAVNSIEKSKIIKDGAGCLYNYIVLNVQMNSSSPSGIPIEYEMSVPITVSEWNTTDFVLLQVNGNNKKVTATKENLFPKGIADLHN